ncbi:oligosaccharide flippase family protein [Flagellimonas sp. S174]|uniref:oligosaccharide flippase family protein n=1 Tax=Flagellimonas sp. S174 TaxID=3410790 RepID=UPI003BF5663E
MNHTIRKVIVMYGSSAVAIILGFLISIFNSRVLGPEKFGDYKFIETVARLIASVVSVGLFISLTRLVALTDDEEKTKKYIGLFTTIFILVSVAGILLFVLFSFIEPYFFEHNLGSTMRRYFFILMAIVGNLAMLEILKGMHKIYTLALLSVVPFLLYLLLGNLFAQFLTFDVEFVLLLYYGLLLVVQIVIILWLKPDFKFGNSILRELKKENKANGRPIYFGSLAGVATAHIAGMSISYFLDNTQVGFYMLALTICTPLLVVPSVLGTTFFKQFVNMKEIPKKVFLFTIAFTGVALIIFYSLIDYVIVLFYTQSFMPVASIAKLLIIGFIFHGFGDLINRFLGAKGKGKLLRNAAFLVGIVNIVGYTIFIKLFGVDGAIITKILASCLYLSVMLFYYNNFIKKTQYVQR